MHKRIVIEAFQKAKENEEIKGIKDPSNNYLSKILSEYILEEMKSPFGERSLKNYYNQALDTERPSEDIHISQLNVVIGLCRYLGYKNYEDYILNQNTNYSDAEDLESTVVTKPKNKKSFTWFSDFLTKNKLLSVALSILILAIIAIISVYILNDQTRWMVWQEDHYVEVDFDTEKYQLHQLKIFKEERITLFKKVSPICEETKFFNEDSSVTIWYGKDKNKELEYFTALGLHPETGKTLKPITAYMINKYICD
ncbi:hypothetical protein ES692_15490 [Psychroserpens burtonensis]|uniref:Uncharacterized protein n=1 Tax=Psychroserpens burtonensis TaxID=49278 RepID=A0A5C7B4I2_9FLAO|nr:hypothetical protein [Psychroserpens burtonensis]TXE15683.1 hypothetical protein ES692_15490 [Psychroserpens burtonensis]